MDQRWYLAIDLGTGGTKVGAVGEDGRVLRAGFSSVDTDLTQDGGAEQDTGQWWTGTVRSVREVVAALDDPGACAGIGITGQWGSTVAVSSDGTALAPCVLWSDHRGALWSKKITGGRVSVSGYAPAKIMQWLRLRTARTRPAMPSS
jgi:xylulokinase